MINSLIFTTIEDESTRSGKRIISIFEQVSSKISAMKSDNAFNFSSDFSKSLNADIEAIQKYKDVLSSGMSQEDAYKATMMEASDAAQKYVQSLNTASIFISDKELANSDVSVVRDSSIKLGKYTEKQTYPLSKPIGQRVGRIYIYERSGI